MMRGVFLALILVTVGVAGCLGDGPSTGPEAPGGGDAPAVLEAMFADGPDHDHANPLAHQLAYRMELLDHLPLGSSAERRAGVHALALHEDTLFLGTGLGPDPGVVAVDVSDPSEMVVLDTWRSPQATGGDRSVAVSEDGRWLFLANEGSLEDQEAGIRVLDVSDPTDLREVAYTPLYNGGHTVETITLDGTIYLFAVSYGVHTYRLVETPGGAELVKVGQYTLATPEMSNVPDYENPSDYYPWAYRSIYAHDMRAEHDPELGAVLYIAYAYQGLHVLDVNQPEAPRLLSTWAPGGEGVPWYTHTVEAAHIGDRRIAVVGSEVFEDRHADLPAPLWILDVTDIQDPQLLATWTNPADRASNNLLFSTHYLRLADGRVHLSHFHGGVWLLDISTPERQGAPEVLGAYLPAQDTGYRPPADCCLSLNHTGVPDTMDVEVRKGVTFAADFHTGLYALRASR